MMHNASVFIPLLWTSVIIGFAYLVWVQAAKESGPVKMTGQIISVVILILALIATGVHSVKPRGHGMRGEMRRPPMNSRKDMRMPPAPSETKTAPPEKRSNE